jgi:hypothetical protein
MVYYFPKPFFGEILYGVIGRYLLDTLLRSATSLCDVFHFKDQRLSIHTPFYIGKNCKGNKALNGLGGGPNNFEAYNLAPFISISLPTCVAQNYQGLAPCESCVGVLKRFVFITNNFELPAESIALLYKYRWKIELFFQWIKQHLKIKSFWGTSANAVRIQIYTAIITYTLIVVIKSKLKSPMSTYESAVNLKHILAQQGAAKKLAFKLRKSRCQRMKLQSIKIRPVFIGRE